MVRVMKMRETTRFTLKATIQEETDGKKGPETKNKEQQNKIKMQRVLLEMKDMIKISLLIKKNHSSKLTDPIANIRSCLCDRPETGKTFPQSYTNVMKCHVFSS